MPSNTRAMNKKLWVSLAIAWVAAMAGCAHVPNQFTEGRAVDPSLAQSDTAADVYARFQPAKTPPRNWPQMHMQAESGAVTHWPLYFEDPFEDKGHGREGINKYYIGWEDYLALAYGYPRYTLNWIALPASAVVQPPWMAMESDGRLSRQALGMDHDATPLGSEDEIAPEPIDPPDSKPSDPGSSRPAPSHSYAPPPNAAASPAPGQTQTSDGSMQIRSLGSTP